MLNESQWQLARPRAAGEELPPPLPPTPHCHRPLMTPNAPLDAYEAGAGNGALNALNYKLNAASAASGHGLDFTNERLAVVAGAGGSEKTVGVAENCGKWQSQSQSQSQTVDSR